MIATEITAICAQIDRRLGNATGTAERAIYFYWSPDADDDVLTRLHADAVSVLHNITDREDPPA